MFISSAREAAQDWGAIATWLRTQGLELDRSSVQQFASGVANLNYLMTISGRRAVLRRPPFGPQPPGAYDLDRQFRVMSHLGPRFPYTPAALAYCRDASVIGVPFLVSEFRAGTAISRTLPDALQTLPNVGSRLSQLMVDSIAELHGIPPQDVGLDGLGKPDGFCARQVKGWHKRASLVLSGAQMHAVESITEWLAVHLPAEQPARIVHLDYKLDNVLIDPVTLKIAGVVDWEMATLGDPLYDLMVMLVTWGEPGDHPVYQRMCCMPCESDGWWSRRQILAAYLERTGTNLDEHDLRFYWVLALLRSYVAGAQLLALYERQPMPNASTVDLTSTVEHGIQHTRRMIDEALDW